MSALLNASQSGLLLSFLSQGTMDSDVLMVTGIKSWPAAPTGMCSCMEIPACLCCHFTLLSWKSDSVPSWKSLLDPQMNQFIELCVHTWSGGELSWAGVLRGESLAGCRHCGCWEVRPLWRGTQCGLPYWPMLVSADVWCQTPAPGAEQPPLPRHAPCASADVVQPCQKSKPMQRDELPELHTYV